MFTVNQEIINTELADLEFQNISCLRLIDILQGGAGLLQNFKTFHVYG